MMRYAACLTLLAACGPRSSSAVGTASIRSSIVVGTLAAAPGSSTWIQLTWDDPYTDEEGYEVERSTDGVNFAFLALAPQNAEAYDDTGLMPQTTYTYRIRGYGNSAFSRYSLTATATTPP